MGWVTLTNRHQPDHICFICFCGSAFGPRVRCAVVLFSLLHFRALNLGSHPAPFEEETGSWAQRDTTSDSPSSSYLWGVRGISGSPAYHAALLDMGVANEPSLGGHSQLRDFQVNWHFSLSQSHNYQVAYISKTSFVPHEYHLGRSLGIHARELSIPLINSIYTWQLCPIWICPPHATCPAVWRGCCIRDFFPMAWVSVLWSPLCRPNQTKRMACPGCGSPHFYCFCWPRCCLRIWMVLEREQATVQTTSRVIHRYCDELWAEWAK